MKISYKMFLSLILLLGACGTATDTTSAAIKDVLGVPKGTKEGNGLSGEFTTILEVTKNRCKDFPSLNVAAENSTQVLNVNVTQDNGVIVFKEIEATLRGGVNFDNTFEAGGARTVNREGEDNVLLAAKIKGKFKDGNNFEAKGTERLTGQILGQSADCAFDFTVKGIRKGIAPTP